MNSSNNHNDAMDSFYIRGAGGPQRSNQIFQITTDNCYHHYEQAVTRGEFGSADSYITPPARQLEQLENRNSLFHPPKKSKKSGKRYLDLSEMQQITKKLNFFEDSTSEESESPHETISQNHYQQQRQQQQSNNGVGIAFNFNAQNNQQQHYQNRNNQKYGKAPSNPESILKFR